MELFDKQGLEVLPSANAPSYLGLVSLLIHEVNCGEQQLVSDTKKTLSVLIPVAVHTTGILMLLTI